MRKITRRFPSTDGIHRLYVAEWLPDTAPVGDTDDAGGRVRPRAVVQVVHGMADRIDRYDELAAHLTARGYSVLGADLLGHGRTALGPGELGVFADRGGWRIALADVLALRREAAARYPGVPHFLLGHSMGSMLVRQFLDEHPGGPTGAADPDAVDGAVLSGTTFMNRPMALAGVAALTVSMRLRGRRGSRQVSPVVERLGRRVGRKFAPLRTDSDWLSRDEDFVDANRADPLCGFPASLSLSRDLMRGCANVGGPAALRRLRTPVLFVSGAEDPLGGAPALNRIAAELASAGPDTKGPDTKGPDTKGPDAEGHPDFTVRLYPGARHEVFGEINRVEVFDDVGDWLDGRSATAP